MARESFGGTVVRESLLEVGFDVAEPRVSLVETTRQRRLDVVMVQNAWNVIDTNTFRRLLEPYPPPWRRRAIARRLVARANLARAKRVVCLTQAVADMCASLAGVQAVVAPVTAPLHDWQAPTAKPGGGEGGVGLVVGSITWYKRPSLAVEIVGREFPDLEKLLFVGQDDGSGAWDDVMRVAGERTQTVTRTHVRHGEIYDLYRASRVVLLPSGLESLGFGLTEAMLHSSTVIASDIPAHLEVARRVRGPQPRWLMADGSVGPRSLHEKGPRVGYLEVRREWERVAEMMTPCVNRLRTSRANRARPTTKEQP